MNTDLPLGHLPVEFDTGPEGSVTSHSPASSTDSSTDIAEADFAETLVTKIGRALHRFGSPAHRLERALDHLSSRLGLNGQFFSTPTAIFASFQSAHPDAVAESKTMLLRVEPGEVNLEKLTLLDGVLGQVTRGELGSHEAVRRVDSIVDAKPRYGGVLTVLAFALASGSTARFFGGGLREAAAAGTIGLLIGLLSVLSEHLPNAGRVFESFAALLAATAATAAAVMIGQVSFYVVTVASLIVLVPGMTLTVAMTELATRNLVSGSARLAGAVLMFMTIGVGFAVGSRLGEILFGTVPAFVPPTPAAWTEGLALVLAAAGLLVLFRARPQDYGWFLLAATVALLGSKLGASLLGPELGALLGAILVGAGSNLAARLRDKPAAVTQMPGLMLLVPGSVGFRSVTALVEQDTLSGVQTGFTVVLIAISLVTGLLVANVLVPSRRAL